MKLKLTIIFSLAVYISIGQISNFQEVSTKHYDSGKSISYLKLEGFTSPEQIYYLETRILNQENILRFEVFKSESQIKDCFVEYVNVLDDEALTVELSALNDEFIEGKNDRSSNFSEFIKWVYQVDDFPNKKNLSRSEYITQRQEWIHKNRKKYKRLSHLDIDVLSQN